MIGLVPEVRFEERRGEFDRDEPVTFPGAACRGQRRVALVVEHVCARRYFRSLARVRHLRRAVKVQAQFDTAGMETARPIQFFGANEVVPFKAETQITEIAEERTPARTNRAPGRSFGERVAGGRRFYRSTDMRHSA